MADQAGAGDVTWDEVWKRCRELSPEKVVEDALASLKATKLHPYVVLAAVEKVARG